MRQKFIDWFFYDPLFKKLNVRTVLDVGSENGKMIKYFSRRGAKVTAIDLEPTRPEIKKMDFLNNVFADGQFDLVYSAHTIEHIPTPEKFSLEMLRVSKQYVCLVAPLPGKQFWDQPDHIRPYTKETLKRIFHLNKWIICKEIRFPGFEPIALVLFDKKDSRLVRN
ncbi:MAG: class I SAM-dependent methyltransferase [Candidatus Diapherotrites archaeon]|nr:class I SAM-dependent methyltransferase [Candidatus Diapherotrites archaeon]MDZ4256196.1 class I SAM-dependent methyltransferase [archaeon]